MVTKHHKVKWQIRGYFLCMTKNIILNLKIHKNGKGISNPTLKNKIK